ncbi:PREDICTED: matrix metalloproteinase-23 isoform X2 [Pseudopodoces humilis]|uniref:matrix metalloproteinase-23 isoform X2 n=1 Tax=Pseudopodoces humilis TaxID=181119 RepID=UPI0006B8140D|nr:PREDICTED: matrix metalloproteinase-23 isoform X2 [Pseudopodoces humilis]
MDQAEQHSSGRRKSPLSLEKKKSSGWRTTLGFLCLFPVLVLLVVVEYPAGAAVHEIQEDVPGSALLIPAPPRPAARSRRYTITPGHLKWDHFNLTYKILSFPRNLLSARDTRRGLAAAFRMWSEVSPFSFREVPRHLPSDLKIGFYSINHTDCLESLTHHCFDGTTGELAHAFFPPHGEIHFDDHEYWILGNTRFSWKKGVWLTDLVHVAAHEIGHALGLMHSLNPNALMHINATLTGKKSISQDEVWGIHRLYEFPFPTVPPTLPPSRTKTKTVSEGRNVTFRCGQKIIHKKGKVYWYKDKELLEYSYPGYLSLNEDHMSIIANAINEGTYTCIVKKKERILTTYSWRIRLKH